MSDWEFEEGEVLEDSNGWWWHVTQRLVDVDSEKWNRYYTLWDATHTDRKECLDAEFVESYERTGIVCNGKPAGKHGYRVNGVLCEPNEVDNYLNLGCLHDHECPNCGEDGKEEIDVIQDMSEGVTRYICRECDREVTEEHE